MIFSWPSENVAGQTKRAIAVALQITVGDIGAIAGVLIYRPDFAANNYRKPHIIAIGYLCFAIAVASYLWIWMSRENRRRDAAQAKTSGKLEALESPEKSQEDLWREKERMGDRYPDYRYQV